MQHSLLFHRFKWIENLKNQTNIPLPRKKWLIKNYDTQLSIVDVLLQNRDLSSEHLEPFRLSDKMHSPDDLPDMQKGVDRILRAIENDEKIVIYGDYDVDGVTSTALMIYFFRAIGYPVDYLVPHREKDGYGLRPAGVDKARELGARLIITVDNGISANEAIDYAAEVGIDVVVTDHHLQEGELPHAAAVINPNRTDSQYPFKTICGVAVAFKLCYALGQKCMSIDTYKSFLLTHLDLVAMGTISDVMPIRDENYAFVKFGLKVLSNTKKPGLIELKKISGVKSDAITPITVGFFLAPRMNAAGRMDDAALAVKLLIEEVPDRAREWAIRLDKLNRQRQTLQQGYLDEAVKTVQNNGTINDKVLIVENEKWQSGLIGLVSGRLKEKFNRPAFAFTRDNDGNFVGSARSIEAFHVTQALTRFSHFFLTYGGHHKAAGLTIPQEKYNLFKQEFIEYVNRELKDDSFIDELEIDSVVDIDQINEETSRQIQAIGPFGETSPEPLFLLEDGYIRDMRTLSMEKHLKFILRKGNQNFECLWWGGGKYKDIVRPGQRCDIVFKLNINVFRGTRRLQLTIEDMALKE